MCLEELANTPRPCFGCRGTCFWESTHGVTLCARCHPPPTPEIELRWIEVEPVRDSRREGDWLGLGRLTDEQRQERLKKLRLILAEISREG